MIEGRILRATAASVVVALCGTAAHLLAGGDVAAWAALLLVLGVLPVALLVTARRLETGQMLGLLLLGQLASHALAGHTTGDGSAMLLAHVLATVASLGVLRHGEGAWWRVVDALDLLVRRAMPRRRVVVPRPRVVVAASEPWFPRLTALVTGVGGRAPPAGA
ncbi:hypothetical protein [Aeromicrobium sp. CTD01-1L150]|uniref:hypothetical protein n=1 Tax=Aeromicrobium sp. CTD01-1L150 TaxID=3341830 RepID=UPI0035C21669